MIIDALRAARAFFSDLMARLSRAAAFENSADNLGAALRWMDEAHCLEMARRETQEASRLAVGMMQRPQVSGRRQSRKEGMRARRGKQATPIHLVAAR